MGISRYDDPRYWIAKRVFSDRVCYDAITLYGNDCADAAMKQAMDDLSKKGFEKCVEFSVIPYDKWHVETYGMPYEVGMHCTDSPASCMQKYFFCDFDTAKARYDKLMNQFGDLDWLVIKGNDRFNEEKEKSGRTKPAAKGKFVILTSSPSIVNSSGEPFFSYDSLTSTMETVRSLQSVYPNIKVSVSFNGEAPYLFL